MMNFIMFAIAIYVALVGASLTLVVLATSKWYIKRCKEMTKKLMEDTNDEF